MKLLPFGLDIGPRGAAIVQCELVRNTPRLLTHAYQEYDASTGQTPDERRLNTINALLANLRGKNKDCVISLSAHDVVVVPSEVPRKARERDLIGAATNEAGRLLPTVPPTRRLVALSPTSDPTQRMLAVGDRQNLDELLGILHELHIRPIACDVPIAVWQRLLAGDPQSRKADALLDLAGSQPALYIFPGPTHVIGRTITMNAGLSMSEVTSAIRTAFITADREEFARVERLAIYSPDSELLGDVSHAIDEAYEGLDIFGLRLDDEESPPWAYALGLATWGAVNRGYLKANMIPPARGFMDVVQRQLVSEDFMRMVGGLATGVALATVYGVGLGFYQRHLETEAAQIQSQIDALAPQRNLAQQYVAADTSLEAIDRTAHWLNHNGQYLALELAHIGNAVPVGRRIWLDDLTATATGWTLQGHGLTLPDEATFLRSLAAIHPSSDTRFGDISTTNHNAFTAAVNAPPPTPKPTPIPQPTPEATP